VRPAPCPAAGRFPEGEDPRPHLLLERGEFERLRAAGRLARHDDARMKRFCYCRWPLYWLDGEEVAVESEEEGGGTTTGN
jgi:hypothetical protein